MALFLADGAFAAGYHYVWQIALFISARKSFAACVAALWRSRPWSAPRAGLCWPPRSTPVHGRRSVLIAYAAAAVVVLLRAASVGSPWLAVTANAAGAFSSALMMPAMMTALYNLAKASPCPLRFHIVTEGAWDIGCGGTCSDRGGFRLAGLSAVGGDPARRKPAAAAAAALLWRYYDRAVAPGALDPAD